MTPSRKPFWTLSFAKPRRWVVLSALLAIELLLVGWGIKTAPSVKLGFLVRDGKGYTVAWKGETRDYEIKRFDSLIDARRFVREELKLSEGYNPLPEHELEHVWMSSRFDSYTLLWKSQRYSFLNQMTFQTLDEAEFFMKAFRRGAYAPSLFGHSVLLVPGDSALLRVN